MKIKELALQNFAGLTMTIPFNEDGVTIKGPNESGKSRIANAISWLFFGKSNDFQSDFSIKTTGLHDVEYSVYAKLEIDGKEYEVKRILKETWSNNRGRENRELTGHETIYEIDHNSVRKKDFDEFFKDLRFELLNPLHFNTLSWEKRRKLLFNIIGEVSDIDIARESFPDLVTQLEKADIDAVKTTVQEKIKKTKKSIEAIPARIDENENSRPDTSQVASARKEKKESEKRIKEIDDQISGLKSEVQTSSEKKDELYKHLDAAKKQEREIKDKLTVRIDKQIEKLEAEKKERKRAEEEAVNADIETWQGKLRELNERINTREKEKTEHESDIKYLEKQIEQKKKEYREEEAKEFNLDPNQIKCPTCGREFDDAPDENKLLEEFNKHKSENLEAIKQEGTKLKESLKTESENLNKITEELNELYRQKQENEDKIEELRNQAKPDVSDIDKRIKKGKQYYDNLHLISDDGELVDVENRIAELNEQINKADESGPDTSELQTEKEQLQSRIQELNAEINKEARNKEIDKRIKELNDERTEYEQELANLQKQQDDIQGLIKAKIEKVNESLESHFAPVSFRMYNEKLNGNLEATCVTMYNGYTWPELSTGAKIKAGLHIIKVLQGYYGVKMPVIIDNHESVTSNGNIDMPVMDAQIIGLYASETEKLQIQ